MQKLHYLLSKKGTISFGVVTFDVGESPEIEDINAIVKLMQYPIFHNYDDGSSTYVWIIASQKLTKSELKELFEYWAENYNG